MGDVAGGALAAPRRLDGLVQRMEGRRVVEAGDEVAEWRPGSGTTGAWLVLGTALTVVGAGVFSLPYAVRHGGTAEVSIGGSRAWVALGATLLLTLGLLIGHELIHGRVMAAFGAHPTYGAGMQGRLMPYFFCTAAGHRFTRTRFILITLAPAIVISLVGATLVAFASFGSWLVFPLAFHLGGCIGDFWMVPLVLRQPPGTLVEDLKNGIRFHRARRRAVAAIP